MNSRCAIAAWRECFQEKPTWCRNEQVCQGRKSVKLFERSNGLDSALYKIIPLTFYCTLGFCASFYVSVFAYEKMLGRSEMKTRERKE